MAVESGGNGKDPRRDDDMGDRVVSLEAYREKNETDVEHLKSLARTSATKLSVLEREIVRSNDTAGRIEKKVDELAVDVRRAVATAGAARQKADSYSSEVEELQRDMEAENKRLGEQFAAATDPDAIARVLNSVRASERTRTDAKRYREWKKLAKRCLWGLVALAGSLITFAFKEELRALLHHH